MTRAASEEASWILVYDDACWFCTSFAQRVYYQTEAFGLDLLPASQAIEYEWYERVRSEIILYHLTEKKTYGGPHALIQLFRLRGLEGIATLLSLPIVFFCFKHAYYFFSYNRRKLFPRKEDIACDCDPMPHPLYNRLLSVFKWLIIGGLLLGAWVGLQFMDRFYRF
jgi:predicted DCC family thiol-disulfide oxidoreductase YuxK